MAFPAARQSPATAAAASTQQPSNRWPIYNLLCGLLRVRIVSPDSEHAAIRKFQIFDQPRIGAILSANSVNRDIVPDLQPSAVGSAEPGLAQRARSRHFKSPMRHFAAVVLLIQI